MRTASLPLAVMLNEDGSKEREATAVSWNTPSSATSIPEIPELAAAAHEKLPPVHCNMFDPVQEVNPPLQYWEAEAMLKEPVPTTERSPEIKRSLAAEM